MNSLGSGKNGKIIRVYLPLEKLGAWATGSRMAAFSMVVSSSFHGKELPARVLGIESSCDETGLALYDTASGEVRHALYSQVAMHREYGGVVPELASRDHIRRVVPLLREVLAQAGAKIAEVDAIAYTEGPGLAGALLVGASVGRALAHALAIPSVGVHHLEGHLLSPLLADPAPEFPYLALLVSGGHSQIIEVRATGDYRLLGDTLDDAAGEAFDKTAQMLGLSYPGGPAIAELARAGTARFDLPRPMLKSGDLDMSFSGLKTAVLTLRRSEPDTATVRADIAASFQEAVVDVLSSKLLAAARITGITRLVIVGGVGANRRLRENLTAQAERGGLRMYYPSPEFCTDNGAMIALAGALKLQAGQGRAENARYSVRPRWELARA